MPVFMRTLRMRPKLLAKAGVLLCILAFLVWVMSVRAVQRDIETLSWCVANKTIVIDAGHGGKDPGVVEGDIIEKEITLAVAKQLGDILAQAGAVVIQTRESDMELTDPGGRKFTSWKREDLNTRIQTANEKKADLFISIHVNSFRSGRREHGAQTFSQPGSEKSRVLARTIQGELVRILGNNHRRAKQVDYYLLRNADIPAVIVEIGFITNPVEGRKLKDPAYQAKVSYALYAGIVKYFGEKADAPAGHLNEEDAIKTFSQPGTPIKAP